jgi:hypothetical protein
MLQRGLACVAVVTLLAVDAAAAENVDDVIARHIAARGGAKKIQAIQSLRMTGRATTGPGKVALVSRQMKRPGRLRTEVAFQGMTGVYIWDGVRGFEVAPFNGSLDLGPLTPENAQLAELQSDMDGPLFDWKAKGHKVELLGREKVGDRELLKVVVTLKSGAVLKQYLDPATYLLVRSESTRVFNGHNVEVETVFGDYKKVGGVLFPHSVESGARGRPVRLKVVVDKIELNPALDDARFKMPEAAGN